MVVYPEPKCKSSPTGSHYFTPVLGSIWQCKYCWSVKWQPSDWDDAKMFSASINRFGLQSAYQKRLSGMPKIAKTLEKLEEIRLIREVMPESELTKVIAAIIADKEFDFALT